MITTLRAPAVGDEFRGAMSSYLTDASLTGGGPAGERAAAGRGGN